jgi:outer membrane protein assembly factor BamB
MRTNWVPLVFVVLAPGVSAGDWPQFLGPDRNNICTETDLLAEFPEGGPKVVWQVEVGEGYGGAAILDGEVFLLDRLGNEQDQLRCWALESGEELWSYAYDAPGSLQYDGSRSVPAVDEKYVFTVGPFGDVHCLDRKTKKPAWSLHLLEDYGAELPMWGISQSVLLHDDLVIIAPSGPEVGVIACERGSGEVVWESGPIGALCYASPMVATIAGSEEIVVLGVEAQDATNTVGLDPGTGDELWRYSDWGRMWPIPGPVDLGGGKLLLSAEYGAGMVVISVEKKGEKYGASEAVDFREAGTPYYASQIHQPIQIDGHLYLISNGFDRKHGMVCLSLEGEVKWATKREPNFELGTLLLADGKLFALDGKDGTLHIIEPDSEVYRELDSAVVCSGKGIWAPMAISEGQLLLRDQKQLSCLDIRKPASARR